MAFLSPLGARRWGLFKSIKRGYYSFWILIVLLIATMFAELWCNSRALLVYYDGEFYFPTYTSMIPGSTFGYEYNYETKYRQLAADFDSGAKDGFALLPIFPYDPYEFDVITDSSGNVIPPPVAPDWSKEHYFGTDTSGRDVLALLVYGFRYAITFSMLLLVFQYLIGVSVGCAMGYFGGWFDLILQRFIEILANVPFLYLVMIVSSFFTTGFFTLAAIMIAFGWTGMTWYMRTAVYKEKEREYSMAAVSIGAHPSRIIFKHLLPNTIALIVTFIPFSISGGIVALTSLDYLGFGLPSDTPSWGNLLLQGTSQIEKSWILSSVVAAMVLILTMVTFVGEAIREAFDPKKFTTYE